MAAWNVVKPVLECPKAVDGRERRYIDSRDRTSEPKRLNVDM